jgi:hypothetical protein
VEPVDATGLRIERRARIAARLVIYSVAIAALGLVWRQIRDDRVAERSPVSTKWLGRTEQGSAMQVKRLDNIATSIKTTISVKCEDRSHITLHVDLSRERLKRLGAVNLLNGRADYSVNIGGRDMRVTMLLYGTVNGRPPSPALYGSVTVVDPAGVTCKPGPVYFGPLRTTP